MNPLNMLAALLLTVASAAAAPGIRLDPVLTMKPDQTTIAAGQTLTLETAITQARTRPAVAHLDVTSLDGVYVDLELGARRHPTGPTRARSPNWTGKSRPSTPATSLSTLCSLTIDTPSNRQPAPTNFGPGRWHRPGISRRSRGIQLFALSQAPSRSPTQSHEESWQVPNCLHDIIRTGASAVDVADKSARCLLGSSPPGMPPTTVWPNDRVLDGPRRWCC